MTRSSAGVILVTCLGDVGDVLLSGPAVRAIAAGSAKVVYLCAPEGREAADMLPGIDEVIDFAAPWVVTEPAQERAPRMLALIDAMRDRQFSDAVILTPASQSPLPIALLLRMAGVPTITGVSGQYPGALLDNWITSVGELHEAQRALAIAGGAGFTLPSGDSGHLAVTSHRRLRSVADGERTQVPRFVVHPGGPIPTRSLEARRWAKVVGDLSDAGARVVVVGTYAERSLVARVAGSERTSVEQMVGYSLSALAEVIGAASVFLGCGPDLLPLAAAVGTPVVSTCVHGVPPTEPWGVPHIVLRDLSCGVRNPDSMGWIRDQPVTASDIVGAAMSLTGGAPEPVPQMVATSRSWLESIRY
jgi:ADP-heptose:LPS heptosyltransferase